MHAGVGETHKYEALQTEVDFGIPCFRSAAAGAIASPQVARVRNCLTIQLITPYARSEIDSCGQKRRVWRQNHIGDHAYNSGRCRRCQLIRHHRAWTDSLIIRNSSSLSHRGPIDVGSEARGSIKTVLSVCLSSPVNWFTGIEITCLLTGCWRCEQFGVYARRRRPACYVQLGRGEFFLPAG